MSFCNIEVQNRSYIKLYLILYGFLILQLFSGIIFAQPIAENNSEAGGYWEPIGGIPPGLNGQVDRIISDKKYLYTVGQFTDAGGDINADYIARWDGKKWEALGSGLNASVSVIELHGGAVYVAGAFTDAGGNDDADYLAKWDGEKWEALGQTENFRSGSISAIKATEQYVYIGGNFTKAFGDPNLNRIARWNGEQWEALGFGITKNVPNLKEYGNVNSIECIGNDVYVAGGSGYIGDLKTNGFAKWNGTKWEAFNTNLRFNVTAMYNNNSNLIIAGKIAGEPRTPDLDYVGIWDGKKLDLLGRGIVTQKLNSYTIKWIQKIDNNIFIGGWNSRDFKNSKMIYRFDGEKWEPFGPEFLGYTFGLTEYNDKIIFGGLFKPEEINGVENIAVWHNDSLEPLGNGINGRVNTIAQFGQDVYIGGEFTNVNGQSDADHIVIWNNGNWRTIGNGLNGNVNAIVVHDSIVYAGGEFTDAGGNPDADYLATWNGHSWEVLGSGINNKVNVMEFHDNTLYVGGEFTNAGKSPNTAFLAKWDGENWIGFKPKNVDLISIGSSRIGLNEKVTELAVADSQVYVGGKFLKVSGDPNANFIVKWDGKNWKSLTYGLRDIPKAIAVDHNKMILISGYIKQPSDYRNTGLLIWRSGWAKFSNYSNIDFKNGDIETIGVNNNEVFLGGSFTEAGMNKEANRIIMLNGSKWEFMGRGILNGTVVTISADRYNVYVGGEFTNAGGKPTANFARWVRNN